MTQRSLPLVLGVALALAGCQVARLDTPTTIPVVRTTGLQVASGAITGVLNAPAGLIANNSAGLIANNGGSLISLTKYHLAALGEAPAAGTMVYLADATGKPLAGIPGVRTDGTSHYAFSRVPPDFTYRVIAPMQTADGQPANLQTLVHATSGGATADISTASTFLTAAVLVSANQPVLGTLDQTTFDRAVAATATQLDASDLTKLTSPEAMIARINALTAANSELQSEVSGLQGQLTQANATINQLNAQIAQLNAQLAASPAPSPAASAAATAPSSPAPTGNPSGPVVTPTGGSTPPPATPSATPTAPARTGFSTVSTIAGGHYGSANGTGTAASFKTPYGLAFGQDGTLYIADGQNYALRAMTPDGQVRTVAGGTSGYADGTGAAAQFGGLAHLAIDPAGNVIVADDADNCIRRVSPQGVVTTIAGAPTAGFVDGIGTAARFNKPTGVAVDAQGDIFVADTDNNAIRRIDPSGHVSTFAGASAYGYQDGQGTTARFRTPSSLAIDTAGNLYVTDNNNFVIRKIDPSGQVTTYAGQVVTDSTGKPVGGFADGAASVARFNYANGLTFDASGNLYVSDGTNGRLRVVSPTGMVSTLAGGTLGYQDGPLSGAQFNYTRGLAFDAHGTLYVADMNNRAIRTIR